MNRPLQLALAVALALGSPAAFGLGLGAITVKSGLNEPLLAEIQVTGAEEEGAAQTLKVELAESADFQRVGLDLRNLTVPLDFTVGTNSAGNPIIVVTSTDPVKEPILGFLVEVNWSTGRLLREYTILLDPPVAPAVIGTRTVVEPLREAPVEPPPQLEAAEPQPVEPAPEPAPEPTAPVAETEPAPVEATPEPAPAEPAPEPAPEPVAAEPAPEPVAPEPSAPGEYGPIATGETLWEIASNTRQGSVSVNQMMVAILRANPQAFFRDNVNALKRGAILRIPTADEVAALTASDAAAEVLTQNQAWAGGAAPTLVADSGYTPPSRTPEVAPTQPDDGSLQLVPPRAGDEAPTAGDSPGTAQGTAQNAALRADLARAQEDLRSKEQELVEQRSRVQDLEKLKDDNSRLLQIKENDIAELQSKLREAEAEVERQKQAVIAAQAASGQAPIDTTTAPVDTTPTETTPVDTTPVEAPTETAPVEPTPTETTPVETAPTDPIATTDPATTPTDPATTEPAPTEAATVTPLAETAPVEAAPAGEAPPLPWYRNMAIIGGVLALVVAGALGAVFMRRKKSVAEEAASSRSSVADSFGPGVFSGGAGASSSVADDEERELLERLAGDPTDVEAHLDLLRLYYANRDADKYEAAASAMYAQVTNPTLPAWQRAQEMGRELSPGNPLFEPQPPAPAPAAREEFDFSKLDEPKAAPAAKAAPAQDFDFDLGAKPEPKAAAAPAAEAFDFDLGAPPAKPVAKPAPAPAPAPAFDTKLEPAELKFDTQEMPSLDFEIEKPSISSAPAPAARAPAPAPAPAAAAAESDIFFSGEDAVGTKLDLARAYLDMGDPEGAKSMLQEVMSEGNPNQKTEAQRLLTEIG